MNTTFGVAFWIGVFSLLIAIADKFIGDRFRLRFQEKCEHCLRLIDSIRPAQWILILERPWLNTLLAVLGAIEFITVVCLIVPRSFGSDGSQQLILSYIVAILLSVVSVMLCYPLTHAFSKRFLNASRPGEYLSTYAKVILMLATALFLDFVFALLSALTPLALLLVAISVIVTISLWTVAKIQTAVFVVYISVKAVSILAYLARGVMRVLVTSGRGAYFWVMLFATVSFGVLGIVLK